MNLSCVDSYRHLGVLITNKVNWAENITKLVAAPSKTLGFIKRSLYLQDTSAILTTRYTLDLNWNMPARYGALTKII